MKNAVCSFFAAALAVLAVSCNTAYPTLYYQQIYKNGTGVRTEAYQLYDAGVPITAVPGFQTELQKLYKAYPEATAGLNTEGYRLGWFFRQHEYLRSMGEGIADLCNHAAWFVLNYVKEADRAAYAKRIAALMTKADEPGAMVLLNELYEKAIPGGTISVATAYYDPENFIGLKSTVERFQGTRNGVTNPRCGLTRTYYESGMISMEVFYMDNVPVGYAFTYTPDGKIIGVYSYTNGVRKEIYAAPKPDSAAKN